MKSQFKKVNMSRRVIRLEGEPRSLFNRMIVFFTDAISCSKTRLSFHFGGSTWVALFRKGLKLEGFPQPGGEHNVPVRSELCRVVS